MKRREWFRRSLMGTVGAALSPPVSTTSRPSGAGIREFPPDFDYSQTLARPDWKPQFLSEHQNETLLVLSDLIIPETDTPGARAALVNRFLDHLLAAESRETQREFLNSLAFLDGESRQRYGHAFVHLAPDQQRDLLTFLAYPHGMVTWGDNRSDYPGFDHFRRLKGWISRAYYNSEIGMKELGWDESAVHGPFEGCPHPEDTHR